MLVCTGGEGEVVAAGGRRGVRTCHPQRRGPHAGGGRRPRRRERPWALVWAGGRVGGALGRLEGLELAGSAAEHLQHDQSRCLAATLDGRVGEGEVYQHAISL